MSVLTEEKRMTYSAFRQMEFDDNDPYQYELINGILVRKSSPTLKHQRISGKLYRALCDFVLPQHKGEIFYAPLDVYFDEENTPQPDLVYVSHDNRRIIDEQEGIIVGVPDLIIEIVSRGSIRRDRVTKKEVYERFGVPEYWIIDTNGAIEVFTLQNGEYHLAEWVADEGIIYSIILSGFEIDLKNIFD